MAIPDSSECAEIDRFMDCLRAGVREFGDFRADVGCAAVLSFTLGFLQTVVLHSPAETRENHAARLARVLKRMAAEVEFSYHNHTGKVH